MFGDKDITQNREAFWAQKIYSLLTSTGGAAFYGAVTSATSTTQFKVESIRNLGTNLLNDAYYCQIIQADAAAPEGEIQKVSAYNTDDGDITVDTAFTVAPDVGDYVLILHESVAKMFLIADGTGAYPASIVDNSILAHMMAIGGDVSDFNNATMSMEALRAAIDAIIANQAGTETVSSYDLPNDTAENTLLEITNTKRLTIDSVWLDFVNLVQDVTIKVYHKIDGTNYRQYDSFSWGTSEEDGVLLSPVTINNDWKVTVTSGTAQGAIKAIPYNVIKTTMEA